jgi:hypothetical protein
MSRIVFVIATIMLNLSLPAKGETAQELVSQCNFISTVKRYEGGMYLPDSREVGICWGVFMAMQRMAVYGWNHNDRILGICSPPESTLTQMIEIFLKYARDRPERLHENGISIAWEALESAFPCRRH